ncbi:type II toxin-antitoxin system PemK/MazF family toxin [Paenibacillus spiritus]|uniref:mRNA interferase n=2 Tax=Paenibacillus spiritus TaxID=2496557 RepID=A0A5J5GHP0_9BACL|nr:type II toxin-antitoxin system PemK/MazF family toxin [Paenibacillus spiritus]
MISKENEIRRYDLYLADLGEPDKDSSVQGGTRPVVVVSNDMGNKYSPLVFVVPVTSSATKKRLPTHVEIKAEKTGIAKDSTILFEQIITIPKKQLKYKLLSLPGELKQDMDKAYLVSTGLNEYIKF